MCSQRSVLLILESEINVLSYVHYTILFRSKVREKKYANKIKICLTFYQRYILYTGFKFSHKPFSEEVAISLLNNVLVFTCVDCFTAEAHKSE